MIRTDHLPFCDEIMYGRDCDCGPVPAEVWCSKCDQPSHYVFETTIGVQSLCREHALDLVWRTGARPVVDRYAVVDVHERRHDERYDSDCPVCDRAMDLAYRYGDSLGVDAQAVAEYLR